MTTAFNHDFSYYEPNSDRIHAMNGYIKALKEVFAHIQEITEFDPEKRYIDSVILLEKIKATCNEMQPLFATELTIILKSFSTFKP